MLVAGGGAVAAAAWLDWPIIFGVVGIATIALAWWTRRLPVIDRHSEAEEGWWAELWSWLSQPGSWALFLFVLTFKMGDAAMAPMV